MIDIAPGIIEKVAKEYKKQFNSSPTIAKYRDKLRDGTAGYKDAYKFSVEVGNIRAKAFKQIYGAELPDEKMYFNIADRLIRNTLPEDYKVVSKYAAAVQKIENEKKNIGLKEQMADLDESRIKGFIERLSSGESFDDIAWILDEPVKVFTQSAVDDTIKKNATFQHNAGIKATIIRHADSKCCAWCDSLAGEYTYPGVPNEVFMRHDNCRCSLEYDGNRLSAYSRNFM